MTKVVFKINNILKKTNFNYSNVFVRKFNVWTKDKIVKSPFKDVEIPEVTVSEYVWQNLDKWPTKTAVVCGITKRTYKYEQVYKLSQILGANLRRKFKINDRDPIAIMLPNMPEYPIIVFGILAAGGIVTTLNPVYTAYEVQRQIQMSNPKLIFANPDTVPAIKQALILAKKKIPIATVDIDQGLPEGTISYKQLVEDFHVDMSVLKQVNTNVNDVSFLLYSSGTTGLPKGVELTNRNIVANFQQQNTECKHFTVFTDNNNQEAVLDVLPFFHSYGLLLVLLHKMSVGLKHVMLPKFHPDTYLNALLEHKIGLLCVVPPTVQFLGSDSRVTSKHFEHINCTMSGAAPLPKSDIYKLFQKAGRELNFVQAYGLTETSPIATTSVQGSKNYTSVGYAVPNVQLRVVNEEMKNLGPGEIGELLIKGPNVMRGYKDNPEANAQVFLKGGWFRSGDLAVIDKSGEVAVPDRLKELIKVNAYQVPPTELEAVLKEHPNISEAAVVGVPDPVTGEKPKGFVVLQEGVKIDEKAILNFVNERVAPYKKIREIVFLDNIPKAASGKILRRILRDKFC